MNPQKLWHWKNTNRASWKPRKAFSETHHRTLKLQQYFVDPARCAAVWLYLPKTQEIQQKKQLEWMQVDENHGNEILWGLPSFPNKPEPMAGVEGLTFKPASWSIFGLLCNVNLSVLNLEIVFSHLAESSRVSHEYVSHLNYLNPWCHMLRLFAKTRRQYQRLQRLGRCTAAPLWRMPYSSWPFSV